jgi:hypothetical protein
MSRQQLGGWGAGLSDPDFSRALALAGLARLPPRASGRRSLHWSWSRALDARGRDASAWARAWKDLFGAANDARVALEVAAPGAGVDLHWLVRTLHAADRVASVTFLPGTLRRRVRGWDWPLDVAFLPDPASRALGKQVQPQYWSHFVRFVDAATAVAQIDLLLFPGTVAEALAALASVGRLVEIHTVLAIGGLGLARDPLAALAALAARADATAAGALELPPPDPRQWLDRVLLESSHDRTLDDALFLASGAAPILLAPHGAFGAASALAAGVRNLRRMAAARPKAAAATAAPPAVLARAGVDGSAPLDAAAPALEATLRKLDWSHEGEGASAASGVGTSAASGDARPDRDGRFVQARVHLDDRPLWDEPLAPGRLHRLDVRVGLPSERWTRAPTGLPEEKLPPSADGHRLTVVLVVPGPTDLVQTATLWLPPTGDTEPCSFHFPAPEKTGSFDARVTVLHRNRILQTLRIRAAVGARASEEPALSIALESVVRANLGDLSGSPGFDAALLLNDTHGEHGLTAFAGDDAAFIRLGGAGNLSKALRAELEKVTQTPGNYATLDTEASRVLLVTLARAGATFASALRELPRMRGVLAPLDDGSRRLQVVSVEPDDLVPLELAYDRAFPKATAVLCPAVKSGGSCDEACPRDADTVCPRGFWGIRHVIERRLYDEHDAAAVQREGADFAIRCEAGEHRAPLATVRTVLYGSANKAASFDKMSFDATIDAIRTALSAANAQLVDEGKWDAWADDVERHHPELLLLLPHTAPELGAAALEIGVDSRIAAEEIKPAHVATPPPGPSSPGPVVLLLGCRTAAEELPFSSFIGAFRRANASVVLATMGTVRGRHMAPVAREVIEMLIERAKQPSSVGALVRDLRLRLLTRGLPVGLTLVAFGEVDWQLGGTP